MNFVLTMAYLFFIGSVTGWVLEVIFRRFFSSANPERKWINPGFLTGPCLPLYGFSLCVLYLLASCEQYIPIADTALRKAVLFALMAAAVTFIEYIAGVIFIKGMHVKLWDYSKQWGNIRGIICPKFSFFWLLLSAAYYFFIHPHILSALDWLSRNLAFSFCIGFFFGVFAIDFAMATRLIVKIRRFADEKGIIVKYEELKAHIRESKEKGLEKARFMLAMSSKTPIAEHLREYYDKLSDSIEHFPGPKTKK